MLVNSEPRRPGRGQNQAEGGTVLRFNYMRKESNGQPIYREDGKIIAQVEGDILRKRIRQEHLLRKPPAIAFDRCALEQAKRAGAVRVEIILTGTNLIYRATMQLFDEKGFPVNRNHGDQVGLALSYWTVRRPGDMAGEQLPLL